MKALAFRSSNYISSNLKTGLCMKPIWMLCREALEQGEQLPNILGSWACPPVGLQIVTVAYFAEDFHLFAGSCTGHPELEQATGLSHAKLEQLLMAVAKLGLEAALQVSAQRRRLVTSESPGKQHGLVLPGAGAKVDLSAPIGLP